MDSQEYDDNSSLIVEASDDEDNIFVMDDVMTQEQQLIDTPQALADPSADNTMDVDEKSKADDYRQQAVNQRERADYYRQLANTYRLKLRNTKVARDRMAHRFNRVRGERDELKAELSFHHEDTAVMVNQLRKPWLHFLQVYNDMRLPVDERLHEGSLEMLLAQVLDAKLQQTVTAAAPAQGQAADAPVPSSNSSAIMVQLPIRAFAGLNLGSVADMDEMKDED
ncbi:hypothetical protein F4810DRAFT_660188 [Camillea tinctor]|nr:hypothetical protein F4810DRAFT_660188 [Camillea tinctor]